MAELHPQQRKDALDGVSALAKACHSPTRDNLLAIVRKQHEKDMRTCLLWVNSYKETFKATGANRWVNTRGPGGTCGVVVVSQFELVEGTKGITFWNYRTRKVVTNKQERQGLLSCGDLDETEQFYSWKTEEFYKGCDYVKYGFF
jgi:hypothetical protein